MPLLNREYRLHCFNAGWIWESNGMLDPDHGRFGVGEKEYYDLGRKAFRLGLPHYGFINPLSDEAYTWEPETDCTKETQP